MYQTIIIINQRLFVQNCIVFGGDSKQPLGGEA